MQLPESDEPLVLADGTKIDPTSGKVIRDTVSRMIPIPSNTEAVKIIARTRRSVNDLPIPPAQLSGVALVAFYSLYGLTDQDISIALDGKLSVDQIENIREQDVYKEFMESAKANILHTDTNTVREMFEQHSISAANKIVELAQSEADVLAFKASQDILDRAGHRPADIVEHRHKLEDALHIIIEKKEEKPQLPYIDVEAREVSNG